MGNKSVIIILIVALVITWIFLTNVILDKPNLVKDTAPNSPKSDFIGKKVVTKVIDGDTVIIDGASVRLLGMDTDERGYPCYVVAKERLEELILGKDVVLEIDAEDKDIYDRYLRFIFLNEKNINLLMVEEGMAVARFTGKGEKYKSEILTAERTARENKIGCKWSNENVLKEKDSAENKSEKSGISTYDCSSNIYNCGDFSSHAEAQAVFESCKSGGFGDIHQLDGDDDGDACETLS